MSERPEKVILTAAEQALFSAADEARSQEIIKLINADSDLGQLKTILRAVLYEAARCGKEGVVCQLLVNTQDAQIQHVILDLFLSVICQLKKEIQIFYLLKRVRAMNAPSSAQLLKFIVNFISNSEQYVTTTEKTEIRYKILLWAVSCGEEDIVQQLITSEPDLLKPGNRPAIGSTTPLIVAARHGHIQMVYQFLNSGASVKEQDPDGKDVIDYALDEKDLILIRHLWISENPEAEDSMVEKLIFAIGERHIAFMFGGGPGSKYDHWISHIMEAIQADKTAHNERLLQAIIRHIERSTKYAEKKEKTKAKYMMLVWRFTEGDLAAVQQLMASDPDLVKFHDPHDQSHWSIHAEYGRINVDASLHKGRTLVKATFCEHTHMVEKMGTDETPVSGEAIEIMIKKCLADHLVEVTVKQNNQPVERYFSTLENPQIAELIEKVFDYARSNRIEFWIAKVFGASSHEQSNNYIVPESIARSIIEMKKKCPLCGDQKMVMNISWTH